MNPIRRWFQRRQLRRFCLHHDPSTGTSFIRSELIDAGTRKLTGCTRCHRIWIV